jgi:high-affinity Fe2+/Pb2+ permease
MAHPAAVTPVVMVAMVVMAMPMTMVVVMTMTMVVMTMVMMMMPMTMVVVMAMVVMARLSHFRNADCECRNGRHDHGCTTQSVGEVEHDFSTPSDNRTTADP